MPSVTIALTSNSNRDFLTGLPFSVAGTFLKSANSCSIKCWVSPKWSTPQTVYSLNGLPPIPLSISRPSRVLRLRAERETTLAPMQFSLERAMAQAVETSKSRAGQSHRRVARAPEATERAADAKRLCAAAGRGRSGRLGGGRTSFDLTVNAGSGNAIRLTRSAPLSADGALDMKIEGRLDAGLANAALSVGGRHVSGTLTGDDAVQRRGQEPQSAGGSG